MTSTNQSEHVGQDVQLFTNPTFGTVRTAGTPDNPYFCLRDLCVALELTPSKAAQRLTKDVLSKYPLPTKGGIQYANFVNEDGLYDVILDSRKPEAKAFRKWITSEVLPAIRKRGGYIRQQEGETEADVLAKALLIAKQAIEDNEKRICALERENTALLEENRKLSIANQAPTPHILNRSDNITIQEAVEVFRFKDFHAFFATLLKDGIVHKYGRTILPDKRFLGTGIFGLRINRYRTASGKEKVHVVPVITPAGCDYFRDYFRERSYKYYNPSTDVEPIDIFAI